MKSGKRLVTNFNLRRQEMTNSELFENLFKLRETYKKEIESLTAEQFLNNVNCNLEVEYYAYSMDNRTFFDLIEKSLYSKITYYNQFTLDESESDYSYKLEFRKYIANIPEEISLSKKSLGEIKKGNKMFFLTLVILSIATICWVFMFFLKNRNETEEIIFGVIFSCFIIFGMYYLVAFLDSLAVLITKKPPFYLDKGDKNMLYQIGILNDSVTKSYKVSEANNFYSRFLYFLLNYYDELIEFSQEDGVEEDSIELIPNYLLEDKEFRLEIDKFGEFNWKDSLYIIKQLFRPVKMQL